MGLTKMVVSVSVVVILFLSFSCSIAQPISSGSEAENSLVDIENSTQPIKQKDDTVRVDPLDHLKKYRGGYEIRDLHYWSSTVYTGVPGYALGVLWLLCGILYAFYFLVTKFCFKCCDKRKLRKRSLYSRQYYIWPVLVAVFFTVLAIIGCGIVLGGDAKFHSRAKTVVDIIIDTAEEASTTIFNTTDAMRIMSQNLDSAYGGTAEAASFLNYTSVRLDSTASDIEREARKNRHFIDLGLKIVYIVTMSIISLTLAASIALLVFGILKLRRALYLFIVICWLLAVFCWLFFGLYFFLENFAEDTCTALESFQRNPYNNTLSSILPCDELVSTQSDLKDVSAGVYNLVNQVNANLSAQEAFVQICNPFSAPPEYNYQPENCPPSAIRIGDIPAAVKLIACTDSNDNNQTCVGGIYIPNSEFRRLEAYTTSIQNLLNAYPGMDSLVECQTVKNAFAEILEKHCKPLKRDTHMVWASMAYLSSVMVILVLLWTYQAGRWRKDHYSDSSVKPHFAAYVSEFERVEAVNKESDDPSSEV
ncbi:uncharacterized protein LOC141678931 [Apium graveolens]|uniref:uncharacterized protein LOC141678931 n=1 Tax=Apium graveolens TaxID=4045 RepID=UPI003D7B3EF2